MPRSPKRRKPGRPATGKRRTFAFHVRESVRSKLEAEARKNHTSVSEEINRRLETTFANYDFAVQLFGGVENLKLLMRISVAIDRSEEQLGRRWFADHAATIRTKAAVMQQMSEHVLLEQLGFVEGQKNV